MNRRPRTPNQRPVTSSRSSPIHSKRSISNASSASGSGGVPGSAIGDGPNPGTLLDCVRMKRRVAVDLSVLRDSRNLRLLVIGELLSGFGSQAVLVAIPFQVYVLTDSAALVGLLGLVELIPIIVFSLLGGAIADRMERRKLMLDRADRDRGLRRRAGRDQHRRRPARGR